MGKKVRVWAATDIVGSQCEDIIEFEDDASKEEIESEARQIAFNFIDWGFEILPNDYKEIDD